MGIVFAKKSLYWSKSLKIQTAYILYFFYKTDVIVQYDILHM